MRTKLAVLFVAMSVAACGGGGGGGPRVCEGASTTPVLTDPDYSSRFVGTYMASGTMVIDYQTLPAGGEVTVSRTGENKLRFGEYLDPFIGLVDDADTASLVCLTDTGRESCGSITIWYEGGTATLTSGAIDIYVPILAEGCGQSLTGYMDLTATPIGFLSDEGVAGSSAPSLMDVVADTIFSRFAR